MFTRTGLPWATLADSKTERKPLIISTLINLPKVVISFRYAVDVCEPDQISLLNADIWYTAN